MLDFLVMVTVQGMQTMHGIVMTQTRNAQSPTNHVEMMMIAAMIGNAFPLVFAMVYVEKRIITAEQPRLFNTNVVQAWYVTATDPTIKRMIGVVTRSSRRPPPQRRNRRQIMT
jgi:hypothetical protein